MREPAAITWPNVDDDPVELGRRVRIIDDLLGAILLLAALVFAALMELTRRRICAVYQLAFLLCAGCAVFIVGGLVDHHLSDDQLQLALYGSFLSSSLTTTYVYLPLGVSAAAAVVGVLHLSVCSCECCCLQGTRCASHRDCFPARLRANSALFATTFLMLWVLIGIRLNARLRASAINPVGGTVHWMLLRSPFYLSAAHIGSIAMVELKLFLQHADKIPTAHDTVLRPTSPTSQPMHTPPLSPAQAEAMASTIDELTRPPPVAKQIPHPTAAVASTNGSSATATAAAIVRRTSRPQTPASEAGDRPAYREERRNATPPADAAKSARRPISAASTSASQRLTLDDLETERPAVVPNNGDVSALISSDSDSDEDVLTPNFTAVSRKKPLPSTPSIPLSRRGASIPSSDYSSSRPTSPAFSSISSRSSSSSSSSSSAASRPRAPPARYARPGEKQLVRSRPSSSEHSLPIHRFASDSEDGDAKRSYYYYYSDSNNNRPMTASSTTSSFSTSSSLSTSTAMSGDGLRRRIPNSPSTAPIETPGTAHTLVKAPWVECFDSATGNVYYYNQVTGESRW